MRNRVNWNEVAGSIDCGEFNDGIATVLAKGVREDIAELLLILKTLPESVSCEHTNQLFMHIGRFLQQGEHVNVSLNWIKDICKKSNREALKSLSRLIM